MSDGRGGTFRRSLNAEARRRVVGVCAVAVLGAALAAAQSPPVAAAARQLVVPFANASGEPRVYWLSEGSAVLVADDLVALGVPTIRREDRVRDPASVEVRELLDSLR